MEESTKSTKKQLQEQKHSFEKEKLEKAQQMKKLGKWGAILVGVLVIGFGAWWMVKESTKPLPGTLLADLGRDHVLQEKWEKFKYNSNPPTSGPHDPIWTKPGIYDKPQGDGHL